MATAECSWAHLKLSGCQPSARQGARDMCGAGKTRETSSSRKQRGVAGGSLQHAEGISGRKECTRADRMEKTLEKRCRLRWVLKIEKEFCRKEKGQRLLWA